MERWINSKVKAESAKIDAEETLMSYSNNRLQLFFKWSHSSEAETCLMPIVGNWNVILWNVQKKKHDPTEGEWKLRYKVKK